MADQYGLGVDLGTTQTAAAVRMDGRVDIVRLGARRPEIPSLVFVKPDGGLLIGDAADRRGQGEPARLAREFKRRIGDPVPILVGGVPFSAHALTAKLLRHVLDAVTAVQEGPPSAVTVTHPANWGPYKREQLDQAVRLADAGPVLLRTEPEAAALQHATARRIADGETVAVYDLGGGTFDAAVLRRDGDGFQLMGEPEGIEQLGGIDFDEAVFGHVVGVLGSKAEGLDPEDPEVVTALARLRRDCVEAKEALSFDTEVMIPVALPGLHTRVRLNRSELESMIAPSLEDTIGAMQRALRSARVEPGQLSAVLLAGGSSQIPLVAQMLSTEFQRPVVADPHPEHSIALGAAVATAAVIGGVSPFANAIAPSAAPPPGRPNAEIPTPPPMVGRPGGTTYGGRPPAGAGTTKVDHQTTVAPPVSPAAPSPGPATSPPGVNGGNGYAPPNGATAAPPPGKVAFTTGAAALPGVPPGGAPAGGAPPTRMPPPGFPGGPPLPGAGKPPGRGRKLIMIGAVVVAVLAASGAAAFVLTSGDKPETPGGGGQALPPATPPAVASSAPAAPAVPYPTDSILVRVDQGDAFPAASTQVAIIDPATGARTPVANTRNAYLPAWSHDRKQIVVTQKNGDKLEGWVMDTNGDNKRKVIDEIAHGRIAWSKDDQKLAYMKKVGGVSQVFSIVIATGSATQLTRSPNAKDDPAWSPDGSEIAYWVTVGKQRSIYALNVENPQEPGKRITDAQGGMAADPAWSPDGSQIAYTRAIGTSGASDIWLANVDGTDQRALTTDQAKEMDPSWSPDGQWVAYTRGVLEKPKITITKVDGSGEEFTLTKGNAREGHPCWS